MLYADIGSDPKEIVDRLERLERLVSELTLTVAKLKNPEAPPLFPSSTIELPIEIIGHVLEFLPQHRVYPFLSLSKGINYIARQRLLKRVYVMLPGTKPLLDDVNEELWRWLFLTQAQFHKLLRLDYWWSGEKVMIDSPTWEFKFKGKLMVHLLPILLGTVRKVLDYTASEFNNFLRACRPIPRFFPLLNLSSHQSLLTLVGTITYVPLPVKLKVTSLTIFHEVNDVAEVVDLASVKQLSVVKAFNNDKDNILNVADQLTSLRDLHLYQENMDFDLSKFPKSIRRFVCNHIHWVTMIEELFAPLLEYLEVTPEAYEENWPRVLKQRPSKFESPPQLDKSKFPKLKVLVCGDSVHTIDRILGEWVYTEYFNYE